MPHPRVDLWSQYGAGCGARTRRVKTTTGPHVVDATPVLRAVPGEKKKAGDASENPESSPAVELERETGFEPATLSLGS